MNDKRIKELIEECKKITNETNVIELVDGLMEIVKNVKPFTGFDSPLNEHTNNAQKYGITNNDNNRPVMLYGVNLIDKIT